MNACLQHQVIKAEKSYIDEFVLIGFPNIRATRIKNKKCDLTEKQTK